MGLALQRAATAAVVLHVAISCPLVAQSLGMQIIEAAAGILILIGLWTPVVGAAIAVRGLWTFFFGGGDAMASLFIATLGATLAMIGPGAWSVDARLFGRRQLKRLS
jgi:uncharacterized membrane protein YphA (DoxX/SURF4 family)